jgi:hypothetical protein
MLQLYLQSTAQTRFTKEAVPTVPQGIDAAEFELFVSTLSSKQVRALLRSRAVNVSDCLEREDYIVRACEAWGFTRSNSTAAATACDVRTTAAARSSTAQVPPKHTINLSTERLRAAERKLGRKQQHPGSKHGNVGSNSTGEQSCADAAASTVEHAAAADSAESTEDSTAHSAAATSAFSYPYMDAEEYSSDSDNYCSSSSSCSSAHEHSSKHNATAAGADNSNGDDSDAEAWDWVHTPRGTPTMPETAVDAAATAAAATPDSSRFVQQLRSQMPEQRQPYAHSDSSAADAAAIQAEVHFWTQQQHSTDDNSSAYTAQQAAAVQSDAPAAFWFWGQTAAAAVAPTLASNGG